MLERKKPVRVFELHNRIVEFMNKMDESSTGKWIAKNSTAWTGDEWRARGEELGNDAFLVVTSEGTDWIYLLNGNIFTYDLKKKDRDYFQGLYDEWNRLIEGLGYHWEMGFSWSVHFYPDK